MNLTNINTALNLPKPRRFPSNLRGFLAISLLIYKRFLSIFVNF